MAVACLLLLIAVAGGTLLTFVYDRNAPFPARLCMGATTGLALLAMIGFLFALELGLGLATILLAAAALGLPLLILLRRDCRRRILGETAAAMRAAVSAARKPDRATITHVVFYGLLAIMLSAVFSSAAYQTPDGIFTGVRNNLGDLTLHLQVISSFVQGHNFPPQDPTYAGVRFAYPFLVDFLAAMLVRSGADIISAMWLQNMILALCLVGLIHYWTLLLTRSRIAGLIAPLLVLFSGGLGWVWIFQDLHNSSGGLIALLLRLPHDYTIMDAGGILRWGNSLTTLFVPQRSILFGMPLAICIFCLWWKTVADDRQGPAPIRFRSDLGEAAGSSGGKAPNDFAALSAQRIRDKAQNTFQGEAPNRTQSRNQSMTPSSGAQQPARDQAFFCRCMIAAGLFGGLLPLIHAHTFLVVMGVGACLTLLFRAQWRNWFAFFVAAVVIALPQLLWLARSGGVKLNSYIGWQPGWDHNHLNPALFWLLNTGLFIPLLLMALLWRWPNFACPKPLRMFYAPFLLCFIVPNLVRLAPWVWDNIKVLFWWYVASAPLVALVLARGLKARRGIRWLAAGTLATLVLAGGLDILRVISGATEYREFNPDGIAMAKLISDSAAPRAVVLHAPVYNSPVFLTGRRSLLGYPGWMWSRGLNYAQRQAEIARMYAGAPDAADLLRRDQVDYVLIGPEELATMKVNPDFWSRYALLQQIDGYRLYRTALAEPVTEPMSQGRGPAR